MRKAPIQSLTADGLRCFFSQLNGLAAISQEDALACHRVIDGIFRQTAVIPIRFPTLIKSDEELHAFLQANSTKYTAALARLRGFVQMELLISLSADVAPAGSGKKYLENRSRAGQTLEAVADAIRASIGRLAAGWRTRAGRQRDALRCYALIARESEKEFRNHIESMPAADGLKITFSGPWPCTEFLDEPTA